MKKLKKKLIGRKRIYEMKLSNNCTHLKLSTGNST